MANRSKQLNQKDKLEPKPLTEEERAEKRRKRIQEYTLMDDLYMSKFFENNIEGAQLVLRIIMGIEDLEVKNLKVQYEVKNLQGRSVEFDVFATDGNGIMYDIEVQKADEGAGAKRARFYSSVIDSNTLEPGEDFEILPNTYVIFITENDVLEGNRPLYKIERKIDSTNKNFNDGSHIIYVNGTYKGNSPLGKLIKDFKCANPNKMCYTILKERSKQLKGQLKEEDNMDRVTQAIYNDGVEEGEIIGELKMLKCYLEAGNSLEDAFNIFKITDEEQQAKFKSLITV